MSFFTETIETQPMQTIREQCEKNQADKPMGESTSAGLSAFLRQVGRAGRMKCGTEVGDGTSV